MKILVIYYSRTGTTKKVAHEIAHELNCDLEEITTNKYKRGLIGYLMAVRDSYKGKLPMISKINSDLTRYDLIIIGTPIWSFTVAAPVRSFISYHRENFKRLVFFCTMGGSGAERAFKAMETISGNQAVAYLSLSSEQLKNIKISDLISPFISRINQLI